MAIRRRGKGRWQVRVRPFPEITVPTREAAEMVELDLKLRVKLGHLYREKPTKLGEELDGLLARERAIGMASARRAASAARSGRQASATTRTACASRASKTSIC